jgi:hypothetical protein
MSTIPAYGQNGEGHGAGSVLNVKRLAAHGAVVSPTTRQEPAALVRTHCERYGKVIREANVKPIEPPAGKAAGGGSREANAPARFGCRVGIGARACTALRRPNPAQRNRVRSAR